MKELESEFDIDIVDEFCDHFELMCDAMEPAILHLSSKAEIEKSIVSLFRIFHNLKSATGFLQLSVIYKLSAFVENYLEAMRKELIPVSEDSVSWFLLISDQYKYWLNNLINDDNEYEKMNLEIFDVPMELENKVKRLGGME